MAIYPSQRAITRSIDFALSQTQIHSKTPEKLDQELVHRIQDTAIQGIKESMKGVTPSEQDQWVAENLETIEAEINKKIELAFFEKEALDITNIVSRIQTIISASRERPSIEDIREQIKKEFSRSPVFKEGYPFYLDDAALHLFIDQIDDVVREITRTKVGTVHQRKLFVAPGKRAEFLELLKEKRATLQPSRVTTSATPKQLVEQAVQKHFDTYKNHNRSMGKDQFVKLRVLHDPAKQKIRFTSAGISDTSLFKTVGMPNKTPLEEFEEEFVEYRLRIFEETLPHIRDVDKESYRQALIPHFPEMKDVDFFNRTFGDAKKSSNRIAGQAGYAQAKATGMGTQNIGGLENEFAAIDTNRTAELQPIETMQSDSSVSDTVFSIYVRERNMGHTAEGAGCTTAIRDKFPGLEISEKQLKELERQYQAFQNEIRYEQFKKAPKEEAIKNHWLRNGVGEKDANALIEKFRLRKEQDAFALFYANEAVNGSPADFRERLNDHGLKCSEDFLAEMQKLKPAIDYLRNALVEIKKRPAVIHHLPFEIYGIVYRRPDNIFHDFVNHIKTNHPSLTTHDRIPDAYSGKNLTPAEGDYNAKQAKKLHPLIHIAESSIKAEEQALYEVYLKRDRTEKTIPAYGGLTTKSVPQTPSEQAFATYTRFDKPLMKNIDDAKIVCGEFARQEEKDTARHVETIRNFIKKGHLLPNGRIRIFPEQFSTLREAQVKDELNEAIDFLKHTRKDWYEHFMSGGADLNETRVEISYIYNYLKGSKNEQRPFDLYKNLTEAGKTEPQIKADLQIKFPELEADFTQAPTGPKSYLSLLKQTHIRGLQELKKHVSAYLFAINKPPTWKDDLLHLSTIRSSWPLEGLAFSPVECEKLRQELKANFPSQHGSIRDLATVYQGLKGTNANLSAADFNQLQTQFPEVTQATLDSIDSALKAQKESAEQVLTKGITLFNDQGIYTGNQQQALFEALDFNPELLSLPTWNDEQKQNLAAFYLTEAIKREPALAKEENAQLATLRTKSTPENRQEIKKINDAQKNRTTKTQEAYKTFIANIDLKQFTNAQFNHIDLSNFDTKPPLEQKLLVTVSQRRDVFIALKNYSQLATFTKSSDREQIANAAAFHDKVLQNAISKHEKDFSTILSSDETLLVANGCDLSAYHSGIQLSINDLLPVIVQQTAIKAAMRIIDHHPRLRQMVGNWKLLALPQLEEILKHSPDSPLEQTSLLEGLSGDDLKEMKAAYTAISKAVRLHVEQRVSTFLEPLKDKKKLFDLLSQNLSIRPSNAKEWAKAYTQYFLENKPDENKITTALYKSSTGNDLSSPVVQEYLDENLPVLRAGMKCFEELQRAEDHTIKADWEQAVAYETHPVSRIGGGVALPSESSVKEQQYYELKNKMPSIKDQEKIFRKWEENIKTNALDPNQYKLELSHLYAEYVLELNQEDLDSFIADISKNPFKQLDETHKEKINALLESPTFSLRSEIYNKGFLKLGVDTHFKAMLDFIEQMRQHYAQIEKTDLDVQEVRLLKNLGITISEKEHAAAIQRKVEIIEDRLLPSSVIKKLRDNLKAAKNEALRNDETSCLFGRQGPMVAGAFGTELNSLKELLYNFADLKSAYQAYRSAHPKENIAQYFPLIHSYEYLRDLKNFLEEPKMQNRPVTDEQRVVKQLIDSSDFS